MVLILDAGLPVLKLELTLDAAVDSWSLLN